MSDPSTSAPYNLIDGRLELVVVDASRNIARLYAVEPSVDSFGVHVVETAWDRVGGWTEAKRVSFAERAEADRVVAHHLCRRASSGPWFGLAYRPIVRE